jgi:hypothetical protein
MARAAEERAAAARLRAEAEEARRRAVKGAVGEWCRVLQPAKMRAGFESSSKPVGLATVGQVRGSTQPPPLSPNRLLWSPALALATHGGGPVAR